MPASASQFLTIDDLTNVIGSYSDFSTIRKFLEAKDFNYAAVMLPETTGKTYSFISNGHRLMTTGNGEALEIADVILVRIDNNDRPRKLTLMTPSGADYECLLGQLAARNFTAKKDSESGKPVVYTSEAAPEFVISLSVTQAVKEGKVYTRYSIAVAYGRELSGPGLRGF